MEQINISALERSTMYGKAIEERELSIYGFKGKMKFTIFDGFAYCPDFNGKEYTLTFPKLEFIEDSIDMQKQIREKLNLDDSDKISALSILQVFNEMTEDGTRVIYNTEIKAYEPKTTYLAQ